jgi:hypothetical protein
MEETCSSKLYNVITLKTILLFTSEQNDISLTPHGTVRMARAITVQLT